MYQAAVITVSDKGFAGAREDHSGPQITLLLTQMGYEVVYQSLIPDHRGEIADTLRHCADEARIPLILTIGGTGFSPRDVTPEATLDVCERLAPGIAEAMRAAGMRITPRAMLSRAVAGIRGRSLILNLPGSPTAALENLEAVIETLDHGLAVLQEAEGECGNRARVRSINISEEKGGPKTPVPMGALQTEHGLAGDAHAGPGPRQVSLLAIESIDTLRGCLPDIGPGAFGENIVTEGISLHTLPAGTKLMIGKALCQVTQVGKDCQEEGCAIRRAVGDCMMPREGVFVRVLAGGEVYPGDEIRMCD